MYIPDSMNPHVLCKDFVGEECDCPTCKHGFILSDGIMHEMFFKLKSRGKNLAYGHVAFCSYECLMLSDIPTYNC